MQATTSNKPSLLSKRPAPRTALAALCLACGILTTASPAATDKSGVIEDETWTPDMSPIHVVGDITVNSLTIKPGVEVLFTGNFEFDCPGVLHAAGDETNNIWFHGDAGPVTWKGLNFLNSAPGSVVDYCTVENSNDHGIAVTNSSPKITNCLIQNNSAPAANSEGAGVYILVNVPGTSIPSLSNCLIQNNSAGYTGGGVQINLMVPGTLVLSECTISNNTSIGGGGVYVVTGSSDALVRFADCDFIDNVIQRTNSNVGGGGAAVTGTGKFDLLRCRFRGNQAIANKTGGSSVFYSWGGGVYMSGGTLSLRNCDFKSNRSRMTGSSCWATGGGLSVYSGNVLLYNCCIRENSVEPGTYAAGGGLYFGSGTARVENCTIINNTYAGIYNSGATLTVLDSILFFNYSNTTQVSGTATITYSDVQNGHAGTGNINQSPLFRSDGTVPSPWPWLPPVPSSWPWPSRLSGSSPCKDAGNSDPSYNDLCFYDTTTTPWGSLGTARNDMGAYGGPGAALWEPGRSGQPEIISITGSGTHRFGDTITLTASVTGIPPYSYQWRRNGEPVTNDPPRVTGANTATLVILNAGADDAGMYTVFVESLLGYGDDTSPPPPAPVEISPLWIDLKMFAGLIIQAEPGKTVRVEYTNDLSSGTWTPLAQIVMPTSPHTYYDADSPNHPKRFYRAVEVPATP